MITAICQRWLRGPEVSTLGQPTTPAQAAMTWSSVAEVAEALGGKIYVASGWNGSGPDNQLADHTPANDSQNAAVTFALAPGDTNPQGIADPPPAGTVLSTGDGSVMKPSSAGIPALPETIASASAPDLLPSVEQMGWFGQVTATWSQLASNSDQAIPRSTVAPPADGSLSTGSQSVYSLWPSLVFGGSSSSQIKAIDQMFSEPSLGSIADQMLNFIPACV